MENLNFLFAITKWLTERIFRLILFLITAGITFVTILYNIDSFTRSAYGTINIKLIAGALVFFPLLVGFFFEFMLIQYKKTGNKAKKLNKQYLKDKF